MELLLIMGIVFAFICAMVAKSKGREPILWAFIGFMTGIIGLLILVCVNDVKDSAQ